MRSRGQLTCHGGTAGSEFGFRTSEVRKLKWADRDARQFGEYIQKFPSFRGPSPQLRNFPLQINRPTYRTRNGGRSRTRADPPALQWPKRDGLNQPEQNDNRRFS